MRRIRSSGEWLAFFQANAGVRDFSSHYWPLLEEERAAITRSIQEFQLGESGEGQHIMHQAKRWAAHSGDTDYESALRLFIAEEIRHSRELAAFMQHAQIPLIAHTWADTVFRNLRRSAGLELSIAVLVCAEIIAKIYYAALRDATGSTHLRLLCEQILRDEKDHVEFQSERLAILRCGLGGFSLLTRSFAYQAFFRLTLLVVWRKHGRAMRAGGWPLRRFWHGALAELAAAEQIMDPRRYAWEQLNDHPALAAGTV